MTNPITFPREGQRIGIRARRCLGTSSPNPQKRKYPISAIEEFVCLRNGVLGFARYEFLQPPETAGKHGGTRGKRANFRILSL